jgi:deazaflavin-dependent oxidoreductase (nitroreductase family)
MTEYDYVKTRREDVRLIDENQARKAKPFMRLFSRLNVWVFKKSNGRLMKKFNGGPVCIVGMRGRKSGRWLEMPLIYLPLDNDVLLVASQGGMPKHPTWYWNIKENPEITVLAEGKLRHMTARQVSDDEKRELWPHLLSIYPDFDEYQARTDRNIPVFRCTESST